MKILGRNYNTQKCCKKYNLFIEGTKTAHKITQAQMKNFGDLANRSCDKCDVWMKKLNNVHDSSKNQ